MFWNWNNQDDDFIIIRRSDLRRQRNQSPVFFVFSVICKLAKIMCFIVIALFIFRKVSQFATKLFYTISSFFNL